MSVTFSSSQLFNHSLFVVLLQFLALVIESPSLSKLASSSLYPLIYVVQQFIHWFFMAYSLIPFCLFTYDKWLKVTSNTQSDPVGQIWFLTRVSSQIDTTGKTTHQRLRVLRPKTRPYHIMSMCLTNQKKNLLTRILPSFFYVSTAANCKIL